MIFNAGISKSPRWKGKIYLGRRFQEIIIYLFIIFLVVLGLCCCGRAFSCCGERGLLFVAVRGLLVAVASLVAEHGL